MEELLLLSPGQMNKYESSRSVKFCQTTKPHFQQDLVSVTAYETQILKILTLWSLQFSYIKYTIQFISHNTHTALHFNHCALKNCRNATCNRAQLKILKLTSFYIKILYKCHEVNPITLQSVYTFFKRICCCRISITSLQSHTQIYALKFDYYHFLIYMPVISPS